MKITNKDIYNNEEFKKWAYGTKLIREEAYIFNKYLNNKNDYILEAGCGGGRILYELQKLGYKSLYGFDNAEKLLNAAIKKQKGKENDLSIKFSLQDASKLNYFDDYFDNIIYLSNILCFIENENELECSIKEAYRVLKPGGMAFFSFLDFNGRWYNSIFAFLYAILRTSQGRKGKFRSLPWLKRESRINLNFYKKKEPLNYWFKKDEAYAFLTSAGFEVIDFFTTKMIRESSLEQDKYKSGGILYIITKKI